MSFLSPWFLIAGLAAMVFPIWLHLLERQNPTRVPFSSLMFFAHNTQRTVRRRHLKYLALLAARLSLIVAGLAVCAACIPPQRERGFRAPAAPHSGYRYFVEYGLRRPLEPRPERSAVPHRPGAAWRPRPDHRVRPGCAGHERPDRRPRRAAQCSRQPEADCIAKLLRRTRPVLADPFGKQRFRRRGPPDLRFPAIGHAGPLRRSQLAGGRRAGSSQRGGQRSAPELVR